MLSTSWDIGNAGLKNAILGFILSADSPFGLLDFENIVLAVRIPFLSCLKAEIEVYPVLEAAILDLLLPVKSNNISGSFIG